MMNDDDSGTQTRLPTPFEPAVTFDPAIHHGQTIGCVLLFREMGGETQPLIT